MPRLLGSNNMPQGALRTVKLQAVAPKRCNYEENHKCIALVVSLVVKGLPGTHRACLARPGRTFPSATHGGSHCHNQPATIHGPPQCKRPEVEALGCPQPKIPLEQPPSENLPPRPQ